MKLQNISSLVISKTYKRQKMNVAKRVSSSSFIIPHQALLQHYNKLLILVLLLSVHLHQRLSKLLSCEALHHIFQEDGEQPDTELLPRLHHRVLMNQQDE